MIRKPSTIKRTKGINPAVYRSLFPKNCDERMKFDVHTVLGIIFITNSFRLTKPHNHHSRSNPNHESLLKSLRTDIIAGRHWERGPESLAPEGNHHHLRHHHEDISWPVKKEAVVEGDLILGGLMMVHEREDSVTCGPVMPQGGIQALETMLYTLDRVNSADRPILQDIKLGAHILDDCDKDTYGLEMALDFIKGSISNIDDAEYHCNKTQVRKVISGVVGAASSVTSIQVANLLRLFKIPQVSFFSTSPELSNKQRFEYFSRTIPSDHYQVKAMVDIVRLMGWSYISIIYEESNYGIKAFEELEDLLAKFNICIAIKEKLVKDSGVARESAYDNIVQKLLTKPRARGCIIFGSDQEVAELMKAIRRCNATGYFSWIGSDGWSARSLVSRGNEAEVEGTLSVQPQAREIRHPTNPTQCVKCPQGTVPDPQHTICLHIPEEYLQVDSGWAIGAMALSSTGILTTFVVLAIFMKYNETPVVRASGRELSYVLLSGILMCYGVTFALVVKPSDVVCGIQRFHDVYDMRHLAGIRSTLFRNSESRSLKDNKPFSYNKPFSQRDGCLLIFAEERNIRQSLMPMRYGGFNKTSTNTNMMAAIMVTAVTCDQQQNVEKHVTPVDELETDMYLKEPHTKDSSTQTSSDLGSNNTNNSLEVSPRVNNIFNIGNGSTNSLPTPKIGGGPS
ncbi:unnamed protein product [Phaedon cochleariae]|uniref:G-protein coupled receptors family 3 profile domain-containing protein n=1 Tax=Phaedon cochleariae TaxID=80249 RepID=A0A9N9SH09_PHACE|nr:unnamed protein product [Phaedon cochleariae]